MHFFPLCSTALRLGFPTNFGGLRLLDDANLLMTGEAGGGAGPALPFGVGHKGATLTGPWDNSTLTVPDVAVIELKVKMDLCWS